MCGIVGYVGSRNAVPLILDGLGRLEYRGYDSAGVAVINGGDIQTRRDVGKLQNLRDRMSEDPIAGSVGIGHTRWATHGEPSERNAHPHVSEDGEYVLVHNGIVENYLELRAELIERGGTFRSDTDTEVIVQLIAVVAAGNPALSFTEVVRQSVMQLRGAHAIVVLKRSQPDHIVAVRIGNAGGVAVGLGEDETYIASDIPAILAYTRRMIFLENREMITITPDAYHIQTLGGTPVDGEIHKIAWDPVSAAKGEYRHFMQKEIFEQARAVTDTIRGRVNFEIGDVHLNGLNLTQEKANAIRRIVIVACGTSYYSGLIGKFFIERMARIPVEVDYASEYRYRQPIVDEDTVILAITQSGETADTLAAVAEAQGQGATVWSIVNAIGSEAMRVSDGVVMMNAGPEIGVASTKAFTTSIVDQFMIAVELGQLRGVLTAEDVARHCASLASLPNLMGDVLEQDEAIEELAQVFYQFTDFLYLGRGINYPTALEGALKLKEISYIHAEGYPAGEMKHGPIALVDEHMPVVAICPQDDLYEKMISQVEQAKARGGRVIAIASEGDKAIADKADHVIYVPRMDSMLEAVLIVLPLQLLAYHIAVWRGADVDQPRNLAKSVTVE